ncbi:MAG: hypothetical protein KDK91_08390 [Gammaproteobacteria bacterium]|nr:hypothetical protein [Gammaproteobacteria bacterium]
MPAAANASVLRAMESTLSASTFASQATAEPKVGDLVNPPFFSARIAIAVACTLSSPPALAHEPSPRWLAISQASPLLRAMSASDHAEGASAADRTAATIQPTAEFRAIGSSLLGHG